MGDQVVQIQPQYRALVIESSGHDLQIKMRKHPHLTSGLDKSEHDGSLKPALGSVVVRVLAAGVLSYHGEVFGGVRPYPFPRNMVGGSGAVARIVAVGADATVLRPGQLVWADSVVRGRDNRKGVLYLSGLHEGFTDGSRMLSANVWRDAGTFADFATVPMESCALLDETRLCRDLGYTVHELTYLFYLLVPFGGFRDIRLEPGETVVVCPATAGFGGAAVMVAAAMGARVIAMGRNEKELTRLKAHVGSGTPGAVIETVKITGDLLADTSALRAFGTIDAVLDVSPPAAAKSTHLKSAIAALRRGGRCSLMGFVEQPIIDWTAMGNDLTFKGKLMYEREDMLLFVKMLERGMFPRGKDFVELRSFGLEKWKEAFEMAATYAGAGRLVIITPDSDHE